ncbi:hypothetical protein [Rossellomorea sp. BNER]|uniref:hypothetical protein n=1 Tax=Rossellomorea sp. BNER TaxID=2962031 RepID=UPI003AF2E6DF|nr:hypothetical protein [Rossellomorea sp. BNER]
MSINLSQPINSDKKTSNLFSCEVFAWMKQSHCHSLKQVKGNTIWQGFEIDLSSSHYKNTQRNSFRVSNTFNTHQRLKLFYLLEFNHQERNHISFTSPKSHAVWKYSSSTTLVDISLQEGILVRKSLYPLTDQGVEMWRETLKSGHLAYQPLLKGPSIAVYSLDIVLKPNESMEGTVFAIQNVCRDQIRKIHYGMKNGLAFPFK